jgi:hypothetical protein
MSTLAWLDNAIATTRRSSVVGCRWVSTAASGRCSIASVRTTGVTDGDHGRAQRALTTLLRGWVVGHAVARGRRRGLSHGLVKQARVRTNKAQQRDSQTYKSKRDKPFPISTKSGHNHLLWKGCHSLTINLSTSCHYFTWHVGKLGPRFEFNSQSRAVLPARPSRTKQTAFR